MKGIKLTQGQVALVDDLDYLFLARFKWRAQKVKNGFYAKRTEGKKSVYMHRQILGLTDPKIEGHHDNGNGLDNRRNNLLVATHSQNLAAFRTPQPRKTSKYRGVSWQVTRGRWQANLRSKFLGYFFCEVEAALAYDRAAFEAFGDFASLNLPEVWDYVRKSGLVKSGSGSSPNSVDAAAIAVQPESSNLTATSRRETVIIDWTPQDGYLSTSRSTETKTSNFGARGVTPKNQ